MAYLKRMTYKPETYKMRAEALIDIYRFLLLFAKKGDLGLYEITGNGAYSDTFITFQTTSAEKTILRILEQVPDSDVMMDTLKLKSEFTGKRY